MAHILFDRLSRHRETQNYNTGVQEDYNLTDAGYDATAEALTELTNRSEDHHIPPLAQKHLASSTAPSHAWLESIIPASTISNLETRFHMGNYVLDRKTGQKSFETMSIYVRLGMHLLYYGSQQEKALHWQRTLDLLEAQSVKMGKQYDSAESRDHIMPFIESFGLQESMKDMVVEDPGQYGTFNEFFGREIKESARPVDELENDLVTSSPADCRLTVFPTIEAATKYWIKGFGFTIERLLGNNSGLAKEMEGGSIAIARLAPQDYHKWHSPIPGTVESTYEIPGAYYTVNPQAINESGTLDVFCENKRSVMIIRRGPTKSPVVIIAVGAMLVGSIKYNVNKETGKSVAEVGTHVSRGQCLGGFFYGGSTVIVLYPKGEVVFDEDLVGNSCRLNMETLVRVGWRIGSKV